MKMLVCFGAKKSAWTHLGSFSKASRSRAWWRFFLSLRLRFRSVCGCRESSCRQPGGRGGPTLFSNDGFLIWISSANKIRNDHCQTLKVLMTATQHEQDDLNRQRISLCKPTDHFSQTHSEVSSWAGHNVCFVLPFITVAVFLWLLQEMQSVC